MLDHNSFNRFAIDETSEKRQWKRVDVGQFYFSSNDRPEPSDLIEWLRVTALKAKKEKDENCFLESSYSENEFGSVCGQFLVLRGYRMETNEEWRKRLKSLINREKYAKQGFELKKSYYETKRDLLGTGYEQTVSKWETALNNIK